MIEDFDSAQEYLAPLPPNVTGIHLHRNKKKNQLAGWQEIHAGWAGITEMMIIGGGPSINTQIDTMRELREKSVFMLTVNGSHAWAIENGFHPLFQMVLDVRPINSIFTRPTRAGTFYLINNQCHPAVLKDLPHHHTYLWDVEKIKGGSTVLLNAVPLLRFMGTSKKIHLFGFDSCLSANEHHGYDQPMNDFDTVLEMTIAGKKFRATRWMVQQAEEFLEQKNWGDFEVHGDGLIAHMLKGA